MTQGRAFEVIAPGAVGEREAAVQAIEAAVADLAQGFARLLMAEISIRAADAFEGARGQSTQGDSPRGAASMDVEAAMQFLGISRDSLYKLIDSGAVTSFKIGGRRLFRPADLEAYRDSRVKARW